MPTYEPAQRLDVILKLLIMACWACLALGILLRLVNVPGALLTVFAGSVAVVASFMILARVVNGPLLGMPKFYLAFLWLGLVCAHIGILYRISFWPGGTLAGAGLLGLPAWALWQRLPASEPAASRYRWARWPALAVLLLNAAILAIPASVLYNLINPKRSYITYEQRQAGWDISPTGQVLPPARPPKPVPKP